MPRRIATADADKTVLSDDLVTGTDICDFPSVRRLNAVHSHVRWDAWNDLPIFWQPAKDPGPGQYRYLQFAWKATSEKTTGVSLLVGRAWPGGGVAVAIGEARWKEGVTVEHRVDGKPPGEWTVVRVDLWAEHLALPPDNVAASSSVDLADHEWPERARENADIICWGERPLVGAVHSYTVGHKPSDLIMEDIQSLTFEH